MSEIPFRFYIDTTPEQITRLLDSAAPLFLPEYHGVLWDSIWCDPGGTAPPFPVARLCMLPVRSTRTEVYLLPVVPAALTNRIVEYLDLLAAYFNKEPEFLPFQNSRVGW